MQERKPTTGTGIVAGAGEAREPREHERQPLTLTLSEKAQQGLLRDLEPRLYEHTTKEMEGGYENRPDIVEQVDAVRELYVTIARHTGREIYLHDAIYMGLDTVPTQDLENFVYAKRRKITPPPGQWFQGVQRRANLLLGKREAKAKKPQNP
jgi:hypothetical protein